VQSGVRGRGGQAGRPHLDVSSEGRDREEAAARRHRQGAATTEQQGAGRSGDCRATNKPIEEARKSHIHSRDKRNLMPEQSIATTPSQNVAIDHKRAADGQKFSRGLTGSPGCWAQRQRGASRLTAGAHAQTSWATAGRPRRRRWRFGAAGTARCGVVVKRVDEWTSKSARFRVSQKGSLGGRRAVARCVRAAHGCALSVLQQGCGPWGLQVVLTAGTTTASISCSLSRALGAARVWVKSRMGCKQRTRS
jgi:hypothetical protein